MKTIDHNDFIRNGNDQSLAARRLSGADPSYFGSSASDVFVVPVSSHLEHRLSESRHREPQSYEKSGHHQINVNVWT